MGKHPSSSFIFFFFLPGSGVALSNEEMVDTVREMKDSYARLVAGVSESQSRESLSPGHLLFLAFDSLFNNYERSVRGVIQ